MYSIYSPLLLRERERVKNRETERQTEDKYKNLPTPTTFSVKDLPDMVNY